jgi:Cu-Zn family superoxide dismutase
MFRRTISAAAVVCFLAAGPGHAQVAMKTADIVGDGNRTIGSVTLTQAPRGVLIKVQASGLAEGWHGMHIHSVATCADPGFKASGGHVHTATSASVHGLLNQGETDLGDLPNIYVHKDGTAVAEVFAPNTSLVDAAGRLNLLDADGSALIIHASPDDHSSQPIGGAGARIACAPIK